jgi:hypothetical protein
LLCVHKGWMEPPPPDFIIKHQTGCWIFSIIMKAVESFANIEPQEAVYGQGAGWSDHPGSL